MAEFSAAIDGDAKGTKHRRSAGHDVHLAKRRFVTGAHFDADKDRVRWEKGGMKKEGCLRKGGGAIKMT